MSGIGSSGSRDRSGRLPRRYALELICGRSGSLPALDGSDMALAHRLVRESIVWRARLDHAIMAFSDRPLSGLDRETLSALRIGAAQLLVLGMPPYAAIDSVVGVLRRPGRRSYVNAVLRRLSREGEPATDDPAVLWSHPPDLVDRWTERFGRSDTVELMRWNNSAPPLGAWLPPGIEAPAESMPGRYLGSWVRMERSGREPLASLETAYFQDEAAAVVGEGFSRLVSGDLFLEIGAAPGGKSVHLSTGGTREGGVCMDISRERLALWIDNSTRLGFGELFPLIGRGELAPFGPHSFRSVLVDAPCTGTGVYRRRHDARWNWSEGLLASCASAQRAMLSGAADLVAPGGCLAYSTCSLEPEEDTGMVIWFEESFPDFERIAFPAPSELVRDDLLVIFPPVHGIDGHFAAAWRKRVSR